VDEEGSESFASLSDWGIVLGAKLSFPLPSWITFYKTSDDLTSYKASKSRKSKGNISQVRLSSIGEERKPSQYRLVTRADDLQLDSDLVAVDTETTSLDPRLGRLVGISLSDQSGAGCYIPVPMDVGLWCKLFRLFQEKILVFHNAKFDLSFLEKIGLVPIRNSDKGIEDTSLIAFLLNQESIGLKSLSKNLLGIQQASFDDIVGNKGDITLVPLPILTEYSSADADVTRQVFGLLQPELEPVGLADLYALEKKILLILKDAETHGFYVDQKRLNEIGKEIDDGLSTKKSAIENLIKDSGYIDPINISSGDQIGKLLFGH
jgi:DNA polymerase I